MIKKLLTTFVVLISTLTLNAAFAVAPDSISGGFGWGTPGNFAGARLSAQWYWHTNWLADKPWRLTGYWDASAAYWHASEGSQKSLFAIAAAPVLRFQKSHPYKNTLRPYIEAGFGPSILSNDTFSSHDLGSIFGFETLVGAGAQFGPKQQYDFSYHFVQYSNYGLFSSHHDNVNVNALISFTYHFD